MSGRTFISMIFDTNQFSAETGSMGECLIDFDENGAIQINPALRFSYRFADNCLAFVVHDDDNPHWVNFDDEQFEWVQDARACGYFFNTGWCRDDTLILTCVLTDEQVHALWDYYDTYDDGVEQKPVWLEILMKNMPSVGRE